ncbi:MAG TPA: hypothetical protein VM764_04145 [Gemmatimonadaceae bacterium]|jgi:hypothetical protein|nr:hypothetical protein [Gemmatimonadaceae bacterium]
MLKFALVIAVLLALPGTALVAQNPPPAAQDTRDAATIIREYYRGPGRGVAESRDQLPAGSMERLRVDATLPEDLARHMLPLPVDLTRTLPGVERGQVRGRIGQRVILIERTSQRILEVVDITR